MRTELQQLQEGQGGRTQGPSEGRVVLQEMRAPSAGPMARFFGAQPHHAPGRGSWHGRGSQRPAGGLLFHQEGLGEHWAVGQVKGTSDD